MPHIIEAGARKHRGARQNGDLGTAGAFWRGDWWCRCPANGMAFSRLAVVERAASDIARRPNNQA